ncbi:MAG: DnaJ domain-containing protein [Campylobacterota bacterium]|nr:DnaJ domain-containing protein [Campylobacterota bacterium]
MIDLSPYERLDLGQDITPKDIKKGYRKAIRTHTPEKHPKEFSQIVNAYDFLSNEEEFLKRVDDSIFTLTIEYSPKQEESQIDRVALLKKVFETPFLG